MRCGRCSLPRLGTPHHHQPLRVRSLITCHRRKVAEGLPEYFDKQMSWSAARPSCPLST